MEYVKHLNLFGVDVKEIPCIPGTGAPTLETEGTAGLFYLDTDTSMLYLCTGAVEGGFGWKAIPEAIVGPQGEQGPRGYQGPRGEQGIQGAPGAAGADGYTPVKGVDYFTEADKEELAQQVQEGLPDYVQTVNGAAPDENGNVKVTSTCELTQPEWGKRTTGTYKMIPGKYVEGASKTLLWENATFSSGFPAQNITLTDLPAPETSGGFTHIEVEFGVYPSRYATDGDVRTVVRIPYSLGIGKSTITGRAVAHCYAVSGFPSFSRDFNPQEGKVQFTECRKLQGTTGATDNTGMVPYKIYGIR